MRHKLSMRTEDFLHPRCVARAGNALSARSITQTEWAQMTAAKKLATQAIRPSRPQNVSRPGSHSGSGPRVYRLVAISVVQAVIKRARVVTWNGLERRGSARPHIDEFLGLWRLLAPMSHAA